MKKIIDYQKNPCWLFHKWVTISDNGECRYEECRKCNSRRAFNYAEYPMNIRWVLGKTNVP